MFIPELKLHLFDVSVPPSGVSISVWPSVLKTGRTAVLTCESGSSNPASTVTWWKNGFMISGEFNGTIEAPNGGKSTRNKLKLNITSQNDGSMYTCQATNKLLKLSVHDGVTLSVKCEFCSYLLSVPSLLELDDKTKHANQSD